MQSHRKSLYDLVKYSKGEHNQADGIDSYWLWDQQCIKLDTFIAFLIN